MSEYNCDDCVLDCKIIGDALCHKGLIDACKQLQAENERLKGENRWIPVSERLPDEGRVWFCYEKTGYTYDGYYQPQYKLWEMFDPCGGYSKVDVGSPPTHWKPIILPTTDGATGGGRDAPLKENND